MKKHLSNIEPRCGTVSAGVCRGTVPRCLLLVALLLAATLAGAVPEAWAGTMFKPTLSAGAGYDSNVRLTREPVGDFFFTERAAATLESGPTTNLLRMRGFVEARQYLRRTDLTRDIDTASLMGEWNYSPTPRWRFSLSDSFTSTYDPVQLSETGELLRVRNDSGRQDSNNLALRVTHQYSERNSVYALTSHQYNQGNTDDIEKSQYLRGEVGATHAFAPNWRVDASTYWARDDFENTPDTDRQYADVRLVHMVSKKEEYFARGSTTFVRSLSEDQLVRDARDYEIYTFQLGYRNAFTQSFTLDAAGGWSTVEGDPTYNSAAGKGFPAVDITLSYREAAWTLTGYAHATLNEYNAEGQNSGLTDSRRVGLNFEYKLTQLLTFSAFADIVHDDFKQDSQAAQTTQQGNVESYRFGGTLSYRFTRDVYMSLDYRYLERNAEVDTDDREQNLITLTINSEWPRRW